MKYSDKEIFEVKAEAYRLMTGNTAPEKDIPKGKSTGIYKAEVVKWDEWLNKHETPIRTMLAGVERMQNTKV